MYRVSYWKVFVRGAEICSDCPDGKTSSDDKVSTCVDCAAGKFSTNGATCKDCAAGTYSGAVAASCTTCRLPLKQTWMTLLEVTSMIANTGVDAPR